MIARIISGRLVSHSNKSAGKIDNLSNTNPASFHAESCKLISTNLEFKSADIASISCARLAKLLRETSAINNLRLASYSSAILSSNFAISSIILSLINSISFRYSCSFANSSIASISGIAVMLDTLYPSANKSSVVAYIIRFCLASLLSISDNKISISSIF